MSGQQTRYHMRHLADVPHAVYVVWSKDIPIYVGMTSNWVSRTGCHMHYLRDGKATHIDVWEVADNRTEAEEIEERTIRALDPRDNVTHSPTHEYLRARWEWYSEWAHAYRQSFDSRFAWAQTESAMAQALAVLNEHGYSRASAESLGLYPQRRAAA